METSNSHILSKKEANVPDELKLMLTFVDKSINNQYLFYYEVFSSRLRELSFEDGLVGKKLEKIIDFRDALKPGRENLYIRLDKLSGFEALGLDCRFDDRGRLVISGVPRFAYKVRVVIKAQRAVFSHNKEEYVEDFDVTRTLSVCSSPAPQSLWENHEPPKDAPYQTPNEQKDSLEIRLETPITVLAASRRGRSHEHVGAFRDDCFALKPASDLYGWHVFAVADGAGSARFSREGAKLACETMTEELSKRLNEPQLFKAINDSLSRNIIQAHKNENWATNYCQDVTILNQTRFFAEFYATIRSAYEAIRQEGVRFNASCGKEKEVSMHDFSTTALCVAMKRFEGEIGFRKDDKKYCPPVWAIISYWVGDGALAVYRPCNEGYGSLKEKEEVLLLGNPDSGEFAGQTQFLTTKAEIDVEPIRNRMRLTFVRRFRGIVMATDGISDPFFPSDSSLKQFEYWRKFWNETLPENFPGVLDKSKTPGERAEALLKGMKFWVRGNHDDRTMALILNDRSED